jgi:AAA15 family ATPase/GTPase
VKVIKNIEGQSKSELIKTVSIQQEHDIQREGYIKSLQSELDSLREQLAKANERVKELDSIADTAFKYNHSSAECLRAWNKLQQLRKEQS